MAELRTFTVVAELRHFARAGERLHLSQPAVSRHISRLEAACGARLLNRTKRRVSLTVAGEAALQHAHTVLAASDRLCQHVNDVATGAVGRVRLGATPTAAFGTLAGVISNYRRQYARFDLEWTVDHIDRLQKAVESNELDMAVVSGTSTLPGLRSIRLQKVPSWIVWAPSLGLPRRPRRWTAGKVSWLVRRPDTPARDSWDQWNRAQPVMAHPALVVRSAPELRAASLAGLGVAVLPATMVIDDVRAGRLLAAKPRPAISHDTQLIDYPHKHHGAACRALLTMIQEAFARSYTSLTIPRSPD